MKVTWPSQKFSAWTLYMHLLLFVCPGPSVFADVDFESKCLILISMSASILILPPGLVHFQPSQHLHQHEEVIFIWKDFCRSRTSPTEPTFTWVWKSGRRRRKMQARPSRWTQKMQRWFSKLFLGQCHWYHIHNIYCYQWNQISIIALCPPLTFTLEYCSINRALSPRRLQKNVTLIGVYEA